METVDVKFIGGAMSGITLTMETNEFQDGDLVNFKGDTYLMNKGRGYFVSTFDDNFKGTTSPCGAFKGTSGHFKNVGKDLKAVPMA